MGVSLSDYVPQDRRAVLARGQTLPDPAQGAALFADISGFTPLTEQLTQQLGPRLGIEELTRRINTVYDAIIGQVERSGGSVISFAGDSITCWFPTTEDGELARPRTQVAGPSLSKGMTTDNWRLTAARAPLCAVGAAQAMQAAMAPYPDLSLKVTVTTGQVRRLVVGDPQIQLLDVLAGATIERLARAEHLAHKGEILADAQTIQACEEGFQVTEWRVDRETGQRFAVLAVESEAMPSPPARPQRDNIPAETLRPWVLPTVFAREQNGLGQFLTELRPAVALFLRFGGIDYDSDATARDKLDSLLRRVQQVVASYEGSAVQLTIGDKGSYLQACFGAPVVHEDDPRRAVRAALALRDLPRELPFLQPVQIGLSRGTLRTGAYGGGTRRTYGALGDDVNIAARLMEAAAPGEVWVSGNVSSVLGNEIVLAPLAPLLLKGKAVPLPVFSVTEEPRRATRLLEPAYILPMIGRKEALALLASKLELARQGKGQVIGITAEAGMGKSRLVAETIRLAQRQGFAGYGGACESSGTNTPYLAWKAIWQAFFDMDPAAPARRQVRHLEGEIENRAPDRLQALPLLAPLLDLQIEDNDFSRTLEPKDRRNALEALLEDCLKAAAREEPILIVLEDVHWMDPLSQDLLEALARATTNYSVCFVLAYRPPDVERLQAPRVEALSNFSRISLNELTPAEAEQLIRAKLAQLYPERGGGLPNQLVESLTARAQGNPFYIEELLNYLRDHDIDPWNVTEPAGLELPSSLHTLILSRIDRLSETQKATLKVASIIGRLFPFAWLHGYYPALGTPEATKTDLSDLARLDLTPLDTPEPELAYQFKHIVTQQVAYESLAYATRAQLHEQLARYLEECDSIKYLNLLAFHYGRSENVGKQREYIRKAGEAAQAAYANATALDYYERLIPLVTEPGEQIDIHLKRGAVLELVGDWNASESASRRALSVAEQSADVPASARCYLALGNLYRERGQYDTSLQLFEQAHTRWQGLADHAGLARARVEIGVVFLQKGEYTSAQQALAEGLALAHAAQDRAIQARALYHLGLVAYYQGSYATAYSLYKGSLELERELGDKSGIGASLGSLGLMADMQGDYAAGQALYEEALALRRETGDKVGMAWLLDTMGYEAARQGEFSAAGPLIEQALALRREMGDKRGIAVSLNNLGYAVAGQGELATAHALVESSLALAREIGNKTVITFALSNLGLVAYYQAKYSEARAIYEEGLMRGREIELKPYIVFSLIGLAGVSISQDRDALRAAKLAGAAEAQRNAIGTVLETLERGIYESAIAMARAALGEKAFNTAFLAGQSMWLDEAVELALAKESR